VKDSKRKKTTMAPAVHGLERRKPGKSQARAKLESTLKLKRGRSAKRVGDPRFEKKASSLKDP
jgi:hypothetical protein